MRLLLSAISLCAFVSAFSSVAGAQETPASPAPKVVTDICTGFAPKFAALRFSLELAMKQAIAAETEAKGLGMWSGPIHFQHLADDANKIITFADASLDDVTDIPIGLDPAPPSDAKTAALGLADAYEKSFDDLKDYAHSALVFDQAAQRGQSAQLGALPLFGAPTTANKINATNSGMNEDQTKADLAGSRGSREVARALKLPQFRWDKACRPATDADSITTSSPSPTQSP